MARGKFITFEGGDGVGKSTQILRLAERLRARGIDCVLTREPGGTPFAERVREFILSGALPAHPAMAEAFLFAAARVDHVEVLIKPALAQGRWVLSDRFADSTRAYQGAAGDVDIDALMRLEELTHRGCAPDLTLMLDLDPTEGRARIASRGEVSEVDGRDPFEGRDLAFQTRLREAFVEIAKQEPERCQVIAADRDVELIDADIWDVVVARLDPETI